MNEHQRASVGTRPRARSSFLVGRVSGIEIRVHFTFVILVALFAVAGTAPGQSGPLLAVLWLAVIFGCVVIHELAHCLVARRRGVDAHEIELLPIGGVSKMDTLPDGPGAELAIAIAGPIASVTIAIVAALTAAALAQPLVPVDLFDGPLLPRVAWFNALVAAFNLIPAFPLDGGRVFRALLERRHDLETATRIAARVGRWVAVALVVTGLFWNVWLVVIGVFVYFGATAEEAATIVHVRLTGNRVGDVMVFDPVVLSPSTTAASARALLRHSPQRVLPVVGPDGYEGLVDADGVERGDPHRAVAELITDAPVVAATDDLEECVPLLVASPVRALAVLDPVGRVVGLLRAEDVERMVRSLVEPTDASDRAP